MQAFKPALPSDRLAEYLFCGRRIGDFDNQLLVELVLERDDDRPRRIADIPEDQLAVVEERTGREDRWSVCTDELETVPPSPRLIVIYFDVENVGQRDFELAAKGPQLVQP